jgi:hypothetical protein
MEVLMPIERDLDSNTMRMTALGGKNPVKVTLTGNVDITVPIIAISSCAGTKIVVDIFDGENLVEDVPIPAPGAIRIMNVVRIKNTGTDATDICYWPDPAVIDAVD